MKEIRVLDQAVIDQIAAGEVVERPSSVVKELVENAIDAKASSITIEIKEGGIELIRVTDNGEGIEGQQVPQAFLRHATSKIRTHEDLQQIHSLGFRGEALSSIAAVSQMELVTKTKDELMGTRYLIEGGKEVLNSAVGAPGGTTFLVKHLFFNIPARKKFLKSSQTEANYVAALLEHMALSHPDISFQFIQNGKTRLHTPGNNKCEDLIYQVYGREFSANLLPIVCAEGPVKLSGYIGKPVINRGNRNFENFFINGRYIRSNILSLAVEEAYQGFLMQHKYPFVMIHIDMLPDQVDVNVHPTKMEVRFSRQEEIYQQVQKSIALTLSQKELIPKVELQKEKDHLTYEEVQGKTSVVKENAHVEPFETVRKEKLQEMIRETTCYEPKYAGVQREMPLVFEKDKIETQTIEKEKIVNEEIVTGFLESQTMADIHLIGQVFRTYWIAEYKNSMYLIDQHAAHERILYEHTMKQVLTNQEVMSQQISPPLILSLTPLEEENLSRYQTFLSTLGYEFESFGGKDYAVSAVPFHMVDINSKNLLLEFLDTLEELPLRQTQESILERVAMMSCKAAVKGNQKISAPEVKAILQELLTLDNPYHCPHGRPTMIEISRTELEKKFSRIV